MTVQERLDAARVKLTRLEAQYEQHRARSEAVTPGGLTGYDTALLSGIRRKPNRKADERRYNAYDREAAAAKELDVQRRLVAQLVREVAEAARVRLSRDDLVGATHVRTAHGWHKVVRLNKTTVSVETGYSWVDRVVFDKVLEARTVTL